MTEFNIGPIPEDDHARLIHLSHAFGRLLFDKARTPWLERAASMNDAVRAEVEELLDGQLFAVVEILDGFYGPTTSEGVWVEFVLSARLEDRESGEVIDEVELGPNGEGLCIGYHSWTDDDFGKVPPP